MINGVGSSSQTRIGLTKDSGKVGTTTGAAAVSTTAESDDTKPMTLVAALAEAGPPIDTSKIEAIKSAIAQGRYPLDPRAIAQKMLALDLPKGNA